MPHDLGFRSTVDQVEAVRLTAYFSRVSLEVIVLRFGWGPALTNNCPWRVSRVKALDVTRYVPRCCYLKSSSLDIYPSSSCRLSVILTTTKEER